jgi:DNA-directed RNA polymerase specialized sigma subunit
MAHVDSSTTEKQLLQRYNLTTVSGVVNLLKDIHTLREQRFLGSDSTVFSCILVDFERLYYKAKLTGKQDQVLFLCFEKDMLQAEVAKELNVTQQAISKHIDTAIAKIVIVAREEEAKNV